MDVMPPFENGGRAGARAYQLIQVPVRSVAEAYRAPFRGW